MTPFELQVTFSVLGAIVLGLIVWVYLLEKRIKRLMAGKNAQSLEHTIVEIGDDIRALEKFQADTTIYLKGAEERIKKSIQGVETIRFNAFKGNGDGGNQSFAIALLSENGDGAVLSSLFARDRMSVFAKPIKNYTSTVEMTDEERDAVKRASK